MSTRLLLLILFVGLFEGEARLHDLYGRVPREILRLPRATQLDEPRCGDQVCSGDENYTSCANDCVTAAFCYEQFNGCLNNLKQMKYENEVARIVAADRCRESDQECYQFCGGGCKGLPTSWERSVSKAELLAKRERLKKHPGDEVY